MDDTTVNATTTTTPSDNADLVSAADVVAKLAEMGLGPETISLAVPLPQQKIRTIISVRKKVQNPDQAALTEDVRRLATLAIKKAMVIIEFGPPEHRLALIRAVISNATKLISVEEDTTTQELRAEFDNLMLEMKDVQPDEDVITDDFIVTTATEEEDNAVEIVAPTPATHNQNHEHGVPQSRFELR